MLGSRHGRRGVLKSAVGSVNPFSAAVSVGGIRLLKNWRFWLGLVVSGGLLWWFFSDIDLEAMVDGFRMADYGVLLWWIVPLTVSYVGRIWRWKLLLDSIHPVSFANAASGTMIGFMANGVLPLRAGELIRPLVVSKNTGYKYSSALATVIFVRILDGLVIMGIFILVVFLIPFGGMLKTGLAIGVGLVYVLGCVAIVVLYYRREATARLLSLPARLFGVKAREKVREFFIHFGDGLHIFNHKGRLWGAIGLSIGIWGLAALSYVPIIEAMPFARALPPAGFDVVIPWYTSLVTMAYVCLGVVFPSAPGFIGIFESFGALGLLTAAPAVNVLYGETAAKGMAGAFAVLLHVTQVLPYILIGAVFLIREGLSLGELSRRGRKREAEVDGAGNLGAVTEEPTDGET